MENRTDLALESIGKGVDHAPDGVTVQQNGELTTVCVTTADAARRMSKPIGKYLTLRIKSFVSDADIFDGRLNDFSSALRSLLPDDATSVLVAGLGNMDITPDSLGPRACSYVLATRHMIDDLGIACPFDDLFPVACISTGVLGDTGIETAEIIRGVADQINPSCVIVVDALASSSSQRLGTTVQLSDTGISPGSGVGNHRHELSLATLGVPVISVGIPTVVSTSVISGNADDSAFVTPREIDRIVRRGARLIGMGINACLQPTVDPRDLYALVG